MVRSNVRPMPQTLAPDEDAELLRQLAQGHQDALGPLYARYAALVFGVAAHSLDRAAAEEIVQDVFLAIWRKAADFDPNQGAFRGWLLQLVHWRVLNELRRRGRRPQPDREADEDGVLASLPDPLELDPADQVSHAERRAVIRSAMDALPDAQRQALSLAFFGDLTHEQVARKLDVPLGTAKTRIRSGLHALRLHLAPIATTLVLLVGVLAAGLKAWQQHLQLDRDERAIGLASASDVERRHLSPVLPGLPSDAHGSYQTRDGASLAIVTITDLPSPPPGQHYSVWVQQQQTWLPLGEVTPDASANGRLIAEDPRLASGSPNLVEVTLESTGSPSQPSGTVVLTWTPS
jgi:RNA polymerase sigma-70 factor, ECF subfamily